MLTNHPYTHLPWKKLPFPFVCCTGARAEAAAAWLAPQGFHSHEVHSCRHGLLKGEDTHNLSDVVHLIYLLSAASTHSSEVWTLTIKVPQFAVQLAPELLAQTFSRQQKEILWTSL